MIDPAISNLAEVLASLLGHEEIVTMPMAQKIEIYKRLAEEHPYIYPFVMMTAQDCNSHSVKIMLDNIQSQYERNSFFWYHLAIFLNSLGDKRKAIDSYVEALSGHPRLICGELACFSKSMADALCENIRLQNFLWKARVSFTEFMRRAFRKKKTEQSLLRQAKWIGRSLDYVRRISVQLKQIKILRSAVRFCKEHRRLFFRKVRYRLLRLRRNMRNLILSLVVSPSQKEKGNSRFFFHRFLLHVYLMTFDLHRVPLESLSKAGPFLKGDYLPPANPSNERLNFNIVHVVWGKQYRDILAEVSLPTQLAAGNLPALALAGKVRYHFYTTDVDAAALKALPIMRCIAEFAEISFCCIDELTTGAEYDKISPMTICHNHAIRNLAGSGQYIIFSAPDAIFANGAFQHLESLARRRYNYVFVNSAMRLSLEGARKRLSSLIENFRITLSPRDLVKHASAVMHSATKGLFFDNKNIHSGCPTVLFWDVPGEGMLSYGMHWHPIMIRAPEIHRVFTTSIDGDMLITNSVPGDKIKLVGNSDDLCVFSMTSDRDLNNWNRTGPYTIDYIAHILQGAADVFHRAFLNFRYDLRYVDPTKQMWDDVGTKAKKIIDAALRTH